MNFEKITKLPLTASSTSRLPAPCLWPGRTPATPPVLAAPPTKPPSSAHGLPPCRPLWLHGREARVPDPLEGRHDLPRHATPSPRSDLDQAGSTSLRSPKPSPLSVLPYKLEPQASTRAPRPLSASRARPTVEPPPPPPYSPIQAAHGSSTPYGSSLTHPPQP